jgi:RNA polymerase sigma-70 factor (ECF subfamily)
VLEVVYLVFNEGYYATAGDDVLRPGLVEDALRLGRMLAELTPNEAEVHGLVALMEIQASRAHARVGPEGEPVLLEDQDRGRWDAARIAEGQELIGEALRAGRGGEYQIQAAIAALHDEAPSWSATDWPQIAGLYRRLVALDPSPVIELNLAAAVAMADGPAIGLAMMDGIAAGGRLETYPYLHAARADLLRRLDRRSEAAIAYRRALELTENRAEQAFLRTRLDELAGGDEVPPRLS